MKKSKRMKKMLSVILAAAVMMSCAVFVSANELSDDMSAAILGAKEKIGLDDTRYVIENCYENEYRGQVAYSITWKSRDDYSDARIMVTADKEGNLWNYSSDRKTERDPFPKGTEEQVEKAAMAFLKKVNPQIAENVTPEACTYRPYGGYYDVQYRRVYQGIPVENTATVSVDGKTNGIVDFHSDWTQHAVFTDAEMISSDKAKEIFKEQIGYRLSYYAVTEYGMEVGKETTEHVRLIYTPDKANQLIDAVTGETLDRYELMYDDGFREESGAVADKNAAAGGPMLSEEEIAYLETVEGLLSRSEAEQSLRNRKELAIPKDLPLVRTSLTKTAVGQYVYELNFSNNAKDETYRYVYARLTAKDGKLLDFSASAEPGKELTDAEKEKAAQNNRSFAESFVKTYYPEYVDSLAEIEANESTVQFERTANGIPFENNGITFGFGTDGALCRFRLTWTEATVPAVGAVQTMDALYEKVLSAENFELFYMPVYRENIYVMKPVYFLKNAENYCPETLQILDYQMLPVQETVSGYTDISGHYGETAIRAMYDADYILGDATVTEFVPAGTVKQEEFLNFISHVLSFGSYNIYARLVEDGVLTKEEIAPEKEITRMEAIRYIVGMLGLSDLAKSDRIFADVYTDVKEADKGFAAIAAGYGIVNSEVTELYPDSLLKRSDAVIMMYNRLTK